MPSAHASPSPQEAAVRSPSGYGGGSYLSAGDPRLHFGLGGSTRIDAIEVRWPSGAVDRYTDLAADPAYLLREGQTHPEPAPRLAKASLRPERFRAPVPSRGPAWPPRCAQPSL